MPGKHGSQAVNKKNARKTKRRQKKAANYQKARNKATANPTKRNLRKAERKKKRLRRD